MHLWRFINTIRYLHPSQVWWQARYRIQSRLENPAKYSTRRPPEFPGCRWLPIGAFLPPGVQRNKARDILCGQLRFINQTEMIGWPPDWNRDDLPKLWLYNLHYFEWIWAFSGDEFDSAKVAALDWMRRYPLARNSVGWEPYPTALRLMNWCSFFFGEHGDRTRAEADFTPKVWASIWLQAEWLSRRLEYHLLGNHLLEDAAALALVGACFDGPDAARWLDTGLSLLREQTAEQILADGLHFERSPMYHSRMVYLFLTLFNTGNSRIQMIVGPVLKRMLGALERTVHPDGQIALLNDSAFGIYNASEELFEYGVKLGVISLERGKQSGPWALPDAGYYGYGGEDGSYIICDAGPLGPDYIPGHSHADMLSFEMSLRGYRIIVDSGVHDYEWSITRDYCRSTRAHNTVEIAGMDQAEMWGAFRVARRGYPKNVRWKPLLQDFDLSASHTGYSHHPGRIGHARTFTWQNEGFLRVSDRITTASDVECISHVHLHPDCRCERQGDREFLVHYPAGSFLVNFYGPGKVDCNKGSYHPEFYTSHANTVLVHAWTATPGGQETGFTIEPTS